MSGVDKAIVLKLIRHAQEGEWVSFADYARFGAEKTGDKRFVEAVSRYLLRDYGNNVIPMTAPEVCECGHEQARHGIGAKQGYEGSCFSDGGTKSVFCDCTGYSRAGG